MLRRLGGKGEYNTLNCDKKDLKFEKRRDLQLHTTTKFCILHFQRRRRGHLPARSSAHIHSAIRKRCEQRVRFITQSARGRRGAECNKKMGNEGAKKRLLRSSQLAMRREIKAANNAAGGRRLRRRGGCGILRFRAREAFVRLHKRSEVICCVGWAPLLRLLPS